jgi:hypothetical protein
VKFFFPNFLGYHGSTSNLEHACENLGGLGPLVWEEIENAQTVHKPKLKFIYRCVRKNKNNAKLRPAQYVSTNAGKKSSQGHKLVSRI